MPQRRGGRRCTPRPRQRQDCTPVASGAPPRPEPTSGLAAEALAGNLVITADRVTAWYRLPSAAWTFRPEADRLAYVAAAAARIASWPGGAATCASLPALWSLPAWAEAFDTRSGARPGPDAAGPGAPMPGPVPDHAPLA